MATRWMGAAVKRMLTPWTAAVAAAGDLDAAPSEARPPHAGSWRTPEGVASWLTFHGVEIRRSQAAAHGARRRI